MKKLLIAAVILAASTSANANLITNGSFESPDQAIGTYSFYKSLPGWTVVGDGSIELRNNVVGTAQDGDNFVELDADFNSSMFQTIATTDGATYQLSYWYSPRVNERFETNVISAYWNGSLLDTNVGAGTSVNNWTQYLYTLTGTGASGILTFSADGVSDSYGGNIDNVQLNAVPVPAAAWLFASAIGLFGFARRSSI